MCTNALHDSVINLANFISFNATNDGTFTDLEPFVDTFFLSLIQFKRLQSFPQRTEEKRTNCKVLLPNTRTQFTWIVSRLWSFLNGTPQAEKTKMGIDKNQWL